MSDKDKLAIAIALWLVSVAIRVILVCAISIRKDFLAICLIFQ